MSSDDALIARVLQNEEAKKNENYVAESAHFGRGKERSDADYAARAMQSIKADYIADRDGPTHELEGT